MKKRKIALIGARGMLASMVRELAPADVELCLLDLPQFDLTDAQRVSATLDSLRPEVIINCAAFTRVDACEEQSSLAFAVNGTGPGYLAEAAGRLQALLVHISTDFVFSGTNSSPYVETDVTEPLSVYGQSKLAGELAILRSGLERYFIVRTSWLYGPNGGNFVETMIRLAGEREELGVVADQIGTPTYSGDLATAIWRLIDRAGNPQEKSLYGIYHYSNAGACSWYDFACEVISRLRVAGVSLKVQQIRPLTTSEYPTPAQRPAYSVLSKDKFVRRTHSVVPPWKESLALYLDQRSV